MAIDWGQAFEIVLKVGSISGLLALLLTITKTWKSRAALSLRFQAGIGGISHEKGGPVYKADRYGTIRNESLDPTSIVRIWPVAWKSRILSRAAYLHYVLNEVDCKGHDAGLPIHLASFGSVEARASFGMNVKRNAHLFDEPKPGRSSFRYNVEMLFEDSRGNLFDERGKLRSLRAIDAWYVLDPEGTGRQPTMARRIWASVVIAAELSRLGFRKVFRRLGLSS